MKRFEHTISAAHGIHLKAARQIVKIARQYSDTAITLSNDQKTIRGDSILRLISLGIRTGDRVEVICEGPEEMAASIVMQNYFWNHL